MSVFGIAMGLLFGLIGTTTLHLAKAMERHGIDLFDRKRSLKEKGKKPLIWFVGFGLNNTQFIWQLGGTYFAPASVYVSVFGIGLVVLLVYSRRILHEEMTLWDWIGSGLIIFGTLFSGFLLFSRAENLTPEINYNIFTSLMISTGIVMAAMIAYSRLRKSMISLFFGLVSGACGGIDNILKHSGLKDWNIWILAASFIMGGVAFLITQWGFVNQANASKLVPTYNSTYIIIPIVYETFIIIGTELTFLQIIAIIIIILGMVFMTAIKKWKTGDKAKKKEDAGVKPHTNS